jgi:cytochrome P450
MRDDTFTSALLEIHAKEPEALTQEEIASILYSLTFAGHETTNHLIGNMLRRLLEEPTRWDAANALGPGNVRNASPESRSFAGPSSEIS